MPTRSWSGLIEAGLSFLEIGLGLLEAVLGLLEAQLGLPGQRYPCPAYLVTLDLYGGRTVDLIGDDVL